MIRTSNAYVFHDPQAPKPSKSENPTGTLNKEVLTLSPPPQRMAAPALFTRMSGSKALPLAVGMRPTRNLVLSLRLSLLVPLGCDHAKLNSQDRGERDEADLQQ